MKTKYFYLIVFLLAGFMVQAQEDNKTDESVEKGGQSRDSQAMDATATQWSSGGLSVNARLL